MQADRERSKTPLPCNGLWFIDIFEAKSRSGARLAEPGACTRKRVALVNALDDKRRQHAMCASTLHVAASDALLDLLISEWVRVWDDAAAAARMKEIANTVRCRRGR